MKTIISICIALFFTLVCACERVEENYLSENVEYAAAQYDLLIEKLEKNGYSQQICLTVRMSDGSWPEEYDLLVTVTPPLYTEKEQLNKDFAEAYFNRGLTHIFLGNNKQGITDLSKAGELGIVSAYNIIKRFTDTRE